MQCNITASALLGNPVPPGATAVSGVSCHGLHHLVASVDMIMIELNSNCYPKTKST